MEPVPVGSAVVRLGHSCRTSGSSRRAADLRRVARVGECRWGRHVAVTPTVLASDRVSLAFDIRTASRQAKPRLVLVSGTTGSLSITPDAAGGERIGISVTWQQ